MTEYTMNCSLVDDRLADVLDGTLTPPEQRAVDAHLAGCARCSALVRELRTISAEARALPALAPSHDLWTGIAERIEAPVLPLAAASPRTPPSLWQRRGRAIAVAAGLVFATAGVTYTLTMSRLSAPETATTLALTPSDSPATSPLVSDSNADPRADAPLARPSDAGTRFADATPSATPPSPAPVTTRLAANSRPAAVPATNTADVLGTEITRLRELLAERRQDLDPRTAAVLENSLRVIDEAIAQSRAALARDPASGFLNEQLNRSLDKKVELLRTAVLLPARAG